MLRTSLQENLRPNQSEIQANAASFESDAVVAGKLKGSRFLSASIKEYWVLEFMRPAEKFFARSRITPNQISLLGFSLTLIASVLLATNHLIWGGWIVIWAGCCDFLDGRIARIKGMTTEAGGFFDSVLDRYMDFAAIVALLFLFRDSWVQVFVYLALLGSVTTPYIRAKAESLGVAASGGEMQRPERVVILGAGAILSGFVSCLSYPFLEAGEEVPPFFLIASVMVVALASNISALQRFRATFNTLKARDQMRELNSKKG